MHELKSGSDLCLGLADLYQQLSLSQIVALWHAFPHLPATPTALYLLATHFHQASWAEINQAIVPIQDKLIHATMPFAIQLAHELSQGLKLPVFSYDMFSRNLLMREQEYLQQFYQAVGTEFRDTVVKENFLERLPHYLALVRHGYGNPYLVQIWEQFGFIRQWKITLAADQGQPRPVPKIAPKESMGRYKPGPLAVQVRSALTPTPPPSEAFDHTLTQLLAEHLRPLSLQIHGPYVGALREIIQAVMGLAAPLPSVDKVSELLLVQGLQASSVKRPTEMEFVIYHLVLELMLGTQNLKYRLNDCTRGLATGLVVLAEIYPDLKEAFIAWILEGILDGIMELYESFSLADNTLRSFLDAYQQARNHTWHQQWEKWPYAKDLNLLVC